MLALLLYAEEEIKGGITIPGQGEIEIKIKTEEVKKEEEKIDKEDYTLIRRKIPTTTLKILEPEGATVEIFSEKSTTPIHKAEIPTSKELFHEGFYKIIVYFEKGKWEKKIEVKKGFEHELYVKALFKEVKGEIVVKIEEKEKQVEKEVKEAKKEIPTPMSSADFRDLIQMIKKETFEETKLSILSDVAEKNYFTVDQVMELVEIFTFEDNKIEAAKTLYPRTVEKGKFYKVYSVFTYSSSKEELKKWIEEYEKGSKKDEDKLEDW